MASEKFSMSVDLSIQNPRYLTGIYGLACFKRLDSAPEECH
jgi:hypothetical protein